MDPKLKMLCEFYDRSDENVNTNALLKVCFFENLKDILNILSHKQQVKFAYLCAKSVYHLNNKGTKEKAKKCLELVEKWLENPDSVSRSELRDAASDTYAAAAADACTNYTNSAYAAAHSAYAASYAAANAAANAAYTTTASPTYAIIDAAYAVNAAANAAKNKQEQEYKNLGFLVKVIKDGP